MPFGIQHLVRQIRASSYYDTFWNKCRAVRHGTSPVGLLNGMTAWINWINSNCVFYEKWQALLRAVHPLTRHAVQIAAFNRAYKYVNAGGRLNYVLPRTRA
eukprot:scaffold50789_cov21-Prasinocladus_malaysianus.AAC.2